MVLTHVEFVVVVIGVVDVVLLSMEVMEVVMEVLELVMPLSLAVVVALATVIIVKGLDILRLIVIHFIQNSDLPLPLIQRWNKLHQILSLPPNRLPQILLVCGIQVVQLH